MTRTLIALVLAVAAVRMHAATPLSKYTGTWILSKADSRDLPRQYESVKLSRVNVAEDGKALKIDVHIEAEGRPEFNQAFSYPLDGTLGSVERTIRTPDGEQKMKADLAAHVKDDVLELEETLNLPPDAPFAKLGNSEVWTLAPDAKTVTVHRKDVRPQGTVEYDLVFKRQP